MLSGMQQDTKQSHHRRIALDRWSSVHSLVTACALTMFLSGCTSSPETPPPVAKEPTPVAVASPKEPPAKDKSGKTSKKGKPEKPAKAPPVVALPAVPETAVTSQALNEPLWATRPLLAPPVSVAGQAAALAKADPSCPKALTASRALVEKALALPVEQLKSSGWKEQALRASEMSLITCAGPEGAHPTGDTGEAAASYWRGVAFAFHGQYVRAAVTFRRVANVGGPYAGQGYAQTVANLLETCGSEDRTATDAWILAGIVDARGAVSDAQMLYGRASQSSCAPLQQWSRARLSVLK